jgi:cobalt-zinc-cadmium efflux system protein
LHRVARAISMSGASAFVVIEMINGLASNSVALLADAGHNLSDALGLGVAWAAVILAKPAGPPAGLPTALAAPILAALFNAVFLLMVDAFMHMAADALVSLGVVVAGFIILMTGWHWIDPVMSIVINAAIVWGTWSLLTGSLTMSLNAVPPNVDVAKVRTFLLGLPGVTALHDLDLWSLSTTEIAMTCHLVTPGGAPSDETLFHAAEELEEHFGIGHVTLQPEKAPSAAHLEAVHNH